MSNRSEGVQLLGAPRLRGKVSKSTRRRRCMVARVNIASLPSRARPAPAHPRCAVLMESVRKDDRGEEPLVIRGGPLYCTLAFEGDPHANLAPGTAEADHGSRR